MPRRDSPGETQGAEDTICSHAVDCADQIVSSLGHNCGRGNSICNAPSTKRASLDGDAEKFTLKATEVRRRNAPGRVDSMQHCHAVAPPFDRLKGYCMMI